MYFFCGLWHLLGINNNHKVVENGCKIGETDIHCADSLTFRKMSMRYYYVQNKKIKKDLHKFFLYAIMSTRIK